MRKLLKGVCRLALVGGRFREWRGTSATGRSSDGFTLLETLVAVSLVTIAIVAPMTLASRALTASYHARDQLIASQLAQEGIEVVRQIRDNNILRGNNPFQGLSEGVYLVDSRGGSLNDSLKQITGSCLESPPPLRRGDSSPFYAYNNSAGFSPDPCNGAGNLGPTTAFTRTVTISRPSDITNGDCGSDPCEMRVKSEVTWKRPGVGSANITIIENLYRWPAS